MNIAKRGVYLMLGSVLISALFACGHHETQHVETQNESTSERLLHARFVPERADDFAWENDKIAMRAYGPALRDSAENAGTDCWLKRVDYPIIDKWYELALNQKISYHEDHGEGLDNYHVGASLGCGGSAIWLNGKAIALETYVRWSDLDVTDKKLSFVLHYQHEIEGDMYQEEKHIALIPAVRLFQVKSVFYVNGQPAEHLPVLIGLTSHEGAADLTFNVEQGWVSAWEVLQGDGLGTAVVAGPQHKVEKIIAPLENNINDQHGLLLTHTNNRAQLEYYVGYGWQKAGAIRDATQWHEYLTEFTAELPY